MGIGASVFLLAVGAVLTFAVHASVSGLDLNVVGVILMVVGALGLAMTMMVLGRRDTVGVAATDRVVTREREVL